MMISSFVPGGVIALRSGTFICTHELTYCDKIVIDMHHEKLVMRSYSGVSYTFQLLHFLYLIVLVSKFYLCSLRWRKC